METTTLTAVLIIMYALGYLSGEYKEKRKTAKKIEGIHRKLQSGFYRKKDGFYRKKWLGEDDR